jgi:amino acid adenylation domain-containing protein/non-ribosomal peptide synthase protein (TIGR01720 family)
MNFKPLEPITPNAISDENISSRQNTILSTVHTLLAELLQIAPSEIDVTMPLLEMGADSIVIAQAIRRIENHFGLTFTIRQIFEELNTPDALASYIEKQLPEIALTEPAGLPLTPAADSNKVLSSGTQKITQTAPDTVLERILSQQIQAMSEQTQAMSEQTQAMSQQTQAMSQLMSQQLEVLRGTQSTQERTEKELGKTEQPIDLKNQLENTDNQPSPLPPWRATEIRAKELSRQQQHHLQALIARYTQKTPKSKQLTQDYRPVLADSRASAGFRLSTKEMLYPIVGKRALGSKTWDVDGNEYIDITMGFGVNLFGHQPTFITEALEKQLKDNMQLGLQTPLAGEVAQLICELTGMERVTFCNSGTEAVMTALRLACTATGRYKIVQFAQSYHGHFDGTLGEPISSDDPTAIPMTPGVKPNMVADVLVLDYGNPQSLEIIQAHANELAAVLVEPVQSRSPHIQPKAFLQQLRQLTLEAKIPLIFDEMITGFRIHLGGAQAWFGVQADIATYGKIVGGGMPIGVVAGKAAYMDGIDGGFWNYGDASYPQADTTFFAGTFCKHPLAMAASLAVLKEIKKQGPTLQAQLNQRTTRLVEHLNHYFEQENVPIRMVHFGSLFRFSYSGNLDLLYYHLLDKGVYVWEGRNCFLSTAHTDEDIDYLIQAVKDTIKALQEGGFLPPRGDKTLASLMQYEHTTQSVGAGIPTQSVGTRRRIPLTEAQKQLWVLTQLGEEGSLAYHVYASLQLKGVIRLKALRQSVQQVVMRHEALQTVINDDGDFQQCHPSLQTEVHLIDLSEYADQACETEIASFFEQESRTPFDLSQGPLFRVHLLKLTEDRHLLVLTAHHIIVDGLSMNLIIQEIGAFYSAACQGITCQLEPPLPFREYIEWQGQQIQTAEMATQEAYWLDKFSESIPVLNLPTDYPYPPIKSYKGSKQTVRLPAKLCRELKVLSQKQGCTPFMTFLSAYTIWLYRITGQNDILLGIPVAGKNLPGSDQLVGYCTHLLPIRSHIVGDETVLAYLKTIRGILLEAYEHQDYPFANLINKLNIKRESSHTPLVSATFNLDKLSARPQLFELEVEWYSQPLYFTAFDIGFNLTDIGEQLILDCEYNTDVFNATTIERFIGQFQVLLEGIVSQPAQSLSQLPLLTEAEQQQLLAWNKTQTDYPKELSIIDLFQAQVEKTPDNIAVVFEEQSVTYQQLNQKANQLAHYLLNLKTNNFSLITDNCLMGICVERSLDMVIGLLGILKAGSAYVPLDPDYPKERLQFMLEDSKVPVLLSQSHLRERLPVSTAIVICLDNDWKKIAAYSEKNPIKQIVPENLAYVIYTSGSTGKPKGVMIEHQALTLHCQAILQQYTLNENDRILQFASFSFDTSLEQLLVAWLSGAGSMLVKSNLIGAQDLLSFLQNHAITVVDLPPAYWQQMLEIETIAKALPALRLLILGGEALLPRLAQQTRSLFPALLCFNAYGPTEAVITPTLYRLPVILPDNTLSVAIGQPRANTRIYILSAQHQPQPIGIPGELCIAGRGLALGYLNRPKLTADKFVEIELFGKTERIYKTGDLARWLSDGNLEYLGRIDNQVKLRGFRIELGEIENVLSQHQAIKEAVVILYDANENKQLVAYLTIAYESSIESTELKDWLKARLPDYMIPSHFTVLEQLPLTPNGKIDRKALPAPELNLTEAYEAPRNDIEQQLAKIWSRLLKQNNMSIHDNFFELGGDSILSIQIVAQARQAGLQLTPRDLFEHQTIAELATVVRFEVKTDADQGLITGDVPLTPIQHWFFAQALPEPWHFNQSILLSLPTDTNTEALRQALAAVLSHHDALRLRYSNVEGHWQQSFTAPIESLPFVVENLSSSEEPITELYKITQRYQASLNLTDGPLTYLVLFKWHDAARLFWCIHHLVVDGVSWRILQEDLQTAYSQMVAGQPIQLPAKTSSVKAWAERLVNYAQSEALASELAHWQALPSFSLPVDNPAGENRLEHHRDYTTTLNRGETKTLLKKVPIAYNTRINDVLLTALALTLSQWTGIAKCLIDLEGHGRVPLFDDIDLSRTVGWFTTIYPIALTLPSSSDLGAALKAIKEQLRHVPLDGIGYGLLTQLSGKTLPKGEILFNYLGQFDQGVAEFEFANETIGSEVSLTGTADHLIEINGMISQGQLRLNWSYSGDCYQEQTIKQLAESYQIHLQNLIRHCQSGKQGVTPSDFPLAQVTQATLDRLYRQYPGLIDLYPLSPMQQGMLFHALYEQETGVYFEQMQLTLSNLDPTAFKAAWQHQLERHTILRSAFLTEHNPVLQVVPAQVNLPWREQDWRGMTSERQQAELNRLLQQERNQGFDLSQAPLMRFDLIRLDEQRYVFIQHHHHILMDGWCLAITFHEIHDSYLAFKQGQSPQLPTPRPYRDYIAWLQQEDSAQHYWQQRLAGLMSPTPLPILNHKTETPDYQEASFHLDAKSTQQLQGFQKAQRLTLNTLIQGAWGLLLSRYSRESDVCFGVTVSGRHVPLSGIEQMMGLFINTLPLRIEVNPAYRVKDYLQKIQTQHQNDNRYAHSPLFEIQNVSQVPNGIALFESLLVFENYPLDDVFESSAACFQIDNFHAIEYNNYPLTVLMIPGESLGFTVSYDDSRISFESIEQLWGHLKSLLMGMVNNPEQSISQLSMLTEKEIQQLQAWNDTATDYPFEQTLVDLFEQQVEKTPDNIAVVFENQQLSYRELNLQSNQLAHYLLKLETDNGSLITDNCLIAIAVERSLEMVIGLLGILKAGCAYVPIDPNYPAARIRYMLDDSAAPLLLTQSHLKAQLPAFECMVVCLDATEFANQPLVNPDMKPQVTDLAYVIYTSGSTGKPKGVAIEHLSSIQLIHWAHQVFDSAQLGGVLASTSICFDLSIFELFVPLSQGGSVIVVKDALQLQETNETLLPMTLLNTVPSAATALLNADAIPNSVQVINLAGEPLKKDLVQALYKATSAQHIYNLYGPSEDTTYSTFTCVAQDSPEAPTIGKPIANTRIYILDAQHQPQPPGIPGELGIAGYGLARGYLNRPKLTAEKFIEIELFGKTERIYKTGDLARWLPDGNLEYLGRIDSQVKLRGFRIELGEIEAVLSQHQAVNEAVVILSEADDNKRLVAYLTTDAESNVLVMELKDWLKTRLPDYMVPSHFTVLDELPLTPNGKIDRKALPEPSIETATGTKPVTPTEALLASLWAFVLKREVIHREDNFFELGGHSLLATQLIARIRDSFQLELPVRAVFEHPQLSNLAKTIDTATSDVRLPPIEMQPDESPKVLSFAQQRLWFLNQFEQNKSATYNMPAALRLSGDLNVAALQRSLQWLLERHTSLRTCFPTKDGQAQVQILNLEGVEVLAIHDLTKLSKDAQPEEIQNRANHHAVEPFNLAQGPLFKAELLLLNEQQSVLLLNMHHIISDGWSIGVFIRDWQHAYKAFAQGEQPNLPPLIIQYSDYAAWQRDWLQGDVLQQQVDYWHEQLKGAPELLELPTDKPRPPKQSYQGVYYAHSLSSTLTKKVTALSQQQGVSVFMTLLSTFYILLSRYSRLNDLCVGTPIAGRTHSQTEDLIGFFVNTLVLRCQLQPALSFTDLLQATRQTCLAAYAHQDIPFEMLVEQLQPTRSLSHSPLFQVMFVLQNNEPAELTLPNLNLSTLESDYPIAKFDLTLSVEEEDGELHCLWEYASDLFYAQTIERMAEHFEILLTAIIDNPAQSISHLPMLTEKEIQQLQAWNDTATDYPFEQTLVDLFEQQVEKTPDNIAVVFENQQLSYRELNLQSNQLAHYLLKLETDNGSLITDNCLIAIAVERSLEMVIGLLAILKAGGAYVPIDPSYPAARIRYMLEDSAAPLLLTQSHLKAQLPALEQVVVCLDFVPTANQPIENPLVKRQATDLAYVIYTSGSTGKPKGVCVPHRAIVRLVKNTDYALFNAEQIFLQYAPISFDAATLEIWGALLHSAKLVVMPAQHQSLEALAQILQQENISVLWLTSSLFNLMLEAYPKSLCRVKQLLTGGETLSVWHIQKALRLLPDTQLINGYGPTENTTFTCCYPISNRDYSHSIPIGKPIANTQVFIVDKNYQPLPLGSVGELITSGNGLARSYLNRPELTADKFIEIELFGKTERIYKTGDLARWLPDGNLEYLGRIDSQVKLRGFRIELGEIEAVLNQHEAVKEAVVILYEADDNKQLVAYLTTDAESNGLIMELKDWLKARLPDYMIPSHLTVLAQLPLTPNGKIDRKALSQLSANSYQLLEGDFVAPSTREEKLLAGIWAEVLGLERVGIHNNFFDLGGHSLLLIRVQAKLSALFDQKISVVELFEYPTIHSLAQHLSKKQIQPSIQNRADNRRAGQPSSSDIAIIGMSGRFPGAATIDEFWQNIRDGVESISFFSDEELIASCTEAATLKQPNYVKASGVLSDIELFDANFFDISPREAQITDPQHRLFLECAWESLESAGYALQAGNQIIGVYAGVSMNTYLVNNLYSNSDALEDSYSLLIGNDKDFLPTRVSYKLNLRGPSITVQTACSTSLVAVHLACQSLLNGECDMALAGGVSISLPQKTGYWYQEGMINSPDGHCRAFDANAKGTVGGNGVGVVVLKRLEQALADGDPVHAVIKGSAVNNDGFLKVGYTAPSVEGQTAVISEAQAMAGIDTETISYIEAHGTGTELGDPIEITALTKAFRASTEKKGFCAIGSLKTNIGHTDAAAGVAGLIKTVLALKHQLLPPSLHFEQPNPQIDFANSPFYVNRTLSEWKSNGIPRRAGVSSFGIGGTNAHVILEEAPTLEPSEPSRPWQLLVLSAKTPSALDTMTTNLANYLAQHPDINLADVAYTLHCGRQSFKQRRMLVCQKTQEAMTALRTGNPESVFTSLQSIENRAVVFMFSGQGAQYVNMGYELYQTEPLFREQVDHCSDYLKAHLGLELRQILYPSQEHKTEATQQINQTAITQTALFVVEYALAKLWMSYGIQPEAMIGHSIGEYVAACLADVFSLEDALSLVAARGQMMQALPFGAMLAVLLPESAVQPLLHNGLSLAAINHPERCVVSGATEAVESLQNQLTQQGVECRRLQTSHAFHSDMMAPIVATFTERVKQVKLNAPHIPYVSNVTGTWITSAEATDPNYWATHLRQTVRFASGLQTVLEDSTRILLEVGPGRTLSTLAKQHPNKVAEHLVLSSLRHPQDNPSDVAFLLNTLGQLWLAGGSVDWRGFYTNERRQRLPLPTYPFERQRYWIEPSDNHQPTQAESLPIIPKEPMVLHSRSDLLKTDVAPRNQLEQTIADIWSKALGIEQVSLFDNFFELGGDSLLAVQIIPQLRDSLQVELFLHHIIEAPTVNQLATLVKEKRIDSQENVSILVEIQLGDESIPPLFCIHPAGGGVFSYLNLAHYLPKQTIYGIQTPSLVGEQEPPSLIKKATYYIEVIKRVQPKGPYLLAGMSYGGNMAVEMAIQLQQQGESIALVALFDSYPPISYENQFEDNWSFLSAFLAASELMLGFQSPDILNDELKKRSENEQWQYILEHVNKLLPEDMVPDEMPKLFNIWKTHHGELRDHVSQIYHGNITLFKAIEKLPHELDRRLNMAIDDALILEGWRQLSSESIEYIKVPGNHGTMLDEPHVQIFAEILKSLIKKALAMQTNN